VHWVQKAKQLVDEELAETKTQLKEVQDELQQAYSNNDRNMAEMQALNNQLQVKDDDLGRSLELAEKNVHEVQKEKRLHGG
jgi:hypothetical protein